MVPATVNDLCAACYLGHVGHGGLLPLWICGLGQFFCCHDHGLCALLMLAFYSYW